MDLRHQLGWGMSGLVKDQHHPGPISWRSFFTMAEDKQYPICQIWLVCAHVSQVAWPSVCLGEWSNNPLLGKNWFTTLHCSTNINEQMPAKVERSFNAYHFLIFENGYLFCFRLQGRIVFPGWFGWGPPAMDLDNNPLMQKLFAYFESVQGSTFGSNHWWDLRILVCHSKMISSCRPRWWLRRTWATTSINSMGQTRLHWRRWGCWVRIILCFLDDLPICF